MKEKANRKIILKYQFKQIAILFLIVINSTFFVSIFARYTTENVKSFFQRTKEFYFFSDKLKQSPTAAQIPQYQIDNWSGVDDYTVTINMNSYMNNLLKTPYDISYDVTYTKSDNIICQLSKTQGTIGSTTNTDFFNLVITPNTTLTTGDRVYVTITVTASQPYEETLQGKFVLVVGQEQLTYEIDDSVNSPYMEVNITNTKSYYIINEAFGTYAVNDKITRDIYLSLSDTNKAKCYSSIVTISFPTQTVLLDMTNEVYANAESISTRTISGYTYIDEITFKVDALSSRRVRFYKRDKTQNYTYPNGNNSPIITLTSV